MSLRSVTSAWPEYRMQYAYWVIRKREKIFFGKHWQVTYQQMQNDPMSCNLLIVLVY